MAVSPDTSTGAPAGSPRDGRIALALACTVAAALVLARSWAHLRFEHLDFDSDQAVIGLMAKHFGDGRAVALYQYAFDYVLVLNAWLAAPLVRFFGASVAIVRVPELLANVLVACLVLVVLVREVGLAPRVALVAALPVILPSPLVTGNLMSTLGGNVEPLVYVLLIWMLRGRPVACGVVAAVGIMTRDFTAYGVAALVAIDLWDGRVFTAARLRVYAVATLTASVLFEAVALLRPHLDRFGPGSMELVAGPVDPSAAARLAGTFCFDAPQAARNLANVFGPYLGKYMGVAEVPDVPPGLGVAGAWPLLVAFVAVIAARAAWRLRSAGLRGLASWPRFPIFLVLVGLQSFVMYAISRCGELSTMTMRYALLGVFAFVGLAAMHFSLERSRWWRGAVATLCVSLAAVAAYDQVRLTSYFASENVRGEHRTLTNYLLARGVRYIRAPYWAVYHVTFLSKEKIVGTPSDWVARVLDYERQVRARPGEVTDISTEPCEGGERVARWYVCHPR
jgi:hypothetical protein